jgi:hypothetical protein
MAKAIRASVVVLLLACSAYAGDIQNGITGTPPPPSHGYIQNGAPDGLTETVLSLLGSVLALF